MTKLESEDYRYGYQHIGIVDDKEVSVRKLSNCGGWLNLDTGEFYDNDSMYLAKAHNHSIDKMNKPIKLSDSEFKRHLKIIHKDDEVDEIESN